MRWSRALSRLLLALSLMTVSGTAWASEDQGQDCWYGRVDAEVRREVRESLREARRAMADARQTIRDAYRDADRAVWRGQHHADAT